MKKTASEEAERVRGLDFSEGGGRQDGRCWSGGVVKMDCVATALCVVGEVPWPERE